MDIIQLQCGSCKKVMAISTAHLGQQVQCPHCKSVVQTPPAAPPPPAPAPVMPDVDATQTEAAGSIPASFEPLRAAPQAAAAPRSPDNTVAMDSLTPPTAETPAEMSPQSEFTKFKPRPRFDRSVYLLIALIFLVPYSLTITAFLAFMLWRGQAAADPLEYIRDPMPKADKGGPRRVQAPHDSPVAAKRKTTLGQKIKAGDLEVTPQKVVLTKKGDLKLFLRARNISANTAFEPMNELYVVDKLQVKPYTFLETRSKTTDPIYGGYLEYRKSENAEPKGDAVLAPKEEITIVLETQEKYRPVHVAGIAKAADDQYTWRVQVRRGFVKVDKKDVSATTVIGVDFSNSDIEREKN